MLRNKIISAKGGNENSASIAFNKKLQALGPNWTLDSVVSLAVPRKSAGVDILFTGVVRVDKVNRIGQWTLSAIGIERKRLHRITVACQRYSGGTKVDNLTACTRAELLKCRNFSMLDLKEVQRALAAHGLQLIG